MHDILLQRDEDQGGHSERQNEAMIRYLNGLTADIVRDFMSGVLLLASVQGKSARHMTTKNPSSIFIDR